MIPPNLRKPNELAWGSAVMEGKQWYHSAILGDWAFGSSDNPYDPTAVYTTGVRAIYYIQSYTSGFTGGNTYYGDNAVYEAISINADGTNNSGFTNVPPTGSNVVPGVPPTSALVSMSAALAWLSQYKWVQVSPDFIGAQERTSYSSPMLLFEYALNRWFNTTFRQPGALWNTYGNDPINNAGETPDIYIGQLDDTNDNMYLGIASDTAFLPIANVTPMEYMMPSNSGGISPYDFIIYVPTAVYTALSPNSGLREGIVRSFADRINCAGMIYEVTTY